MPNITNEFLREIFHGSEDASRNNIAFDFRKPEFNLIQPRRIRRRVMDMNATMTLEELFNAFRLVSREIIDDHVNLFIGGLVNE